MSMKPGEMVRPAQSMVRAASTPAPAPVPRSPIAAMRPSEIAIAPGYASRPVPSRIEPFTRRMSNAMASLWHGRRFRATPDE